VAELVSFASWSLPARERGLKLGNRRHRLLRRSSLPARERGLKQSFVKHRLKALVSLPARERGLKQLPIYLLDWYDCAIATPRSQRGKLVFIDARAALARTSGVGLCSFDCSQNCMNLGF
jgi:hypothetical protein